jgi:nitrate/nitrite transporter NarK
MLSESNRKSSRPGPLTPLALVMILALVMLPTPALAYIDPGTGSFVIQGIIAAVVGAGFAVKMYWHRIKSLFTGKPMPEDDDPDE